jgi:subtilase family serine protease
MRRLRALPLVAMLLLIGMSMVGMVKPASDAAAYSGITVSIINPSYGGMSQTVQIQISVVGGPAADVGGNYTYRDVKMTGANTTGWKAEPISQTSESGVFKFNLTMPAEAGQKVKVTLNVTSTEWRTNVEKFSSAAFEMKVVEPIAISARVLNNGAVDAVNATAEIYADGVLLDTQYINVSAGSSYTIKYNWTFSSIRSGKHVVTVKVDDPNNLVEFNDGNNEYSLTIYVGSQSNPAGPILTIGLMITIVIFVLTYMQKPMRRGKKA